MDDDTGTQQLQSLWIDWADHIVSFHQEDGYERLDFSSNEEKWTTCSRKALPVFASSDRLVSRNI